MFRFFGEFLASVALTGIVGRFACGVVPPPFFLMLPLLLTTPFVVREFLSMTPHLLAAVDNDVFWEKVPNWISAIASVAGVMFAVYAYFNWRRQILNSKRLEAATQLIDTLSTLLILHMRMSVRNDRFEDYRARARAVIEDLLSFYYSKLYLFPSPAEYLEVMSSTVETCSRSLSLPVEQFTQDEFDSVNNDITRAQNYLSDVSKGKSRIVMRLLNDYHLTREEREERIGVESRQER